MALLLLDAGSEQSRIDPKVAAIWDQHPKAPSIQKNFRDLAVDVTEIGIVHIGTLRMAENPANILQNGTTNLHDVTI